MQLNPQANNGEAFGFSARPKVVKPRTKFREPLAEIDVEHRLHNLMFEQRVVRGNTYARIITSKDQDLKSIDKTGNKSLKKTSELNGSHGGLQQLQLQQQQQLQQQLQSQEVGPVPGRLNAEIQTDEFVELLTDKPPQYEKDTQTEVFIDRAKPLLEMHTKTGIDQETQIWDGDIFDFDFEVEPLLQVLLGKTLELSRMEVLEEEELRVMKEQQKRFEQLKNAELAEIQRLEAKEKRLFDENERRKMMQRKQREQNINAHKKLVSRGMAKVYLKKLKVNVEDVLEEQGIFRDPLEISLHEMFVPWLYKSVQEELVACTDVEHRFNDLCEDLVEKNEQIHKQSYDFEMARREEIRAERRRKQKELEDRREIKRIERLRKQEAERRIRLRDDVVARILSKAELKDNALQQLISDIDGNQQEGRPYVGLVGGLVGEFVLFLSALSNSEDPDLAQQIKALIENTESLVGVFRELLVSILSEGMIDLPINGIVNELLDSKINDLNLSNLQTMSLGEDQEEIMEIIQENVSSVILNSIREHAEELSFSAENIDYLLQSIIQCYFSEDSSKTKIKLSSVNFRSNFRNAQGIAYVQPDLSTLALNAKSLRAGIEPEIGEDDEPIPFIPDNIAESEFQNKVSLFVPKDEELEVLVQHAVAEQVVREDILRVLGNSIKGIDGREYTILYEACEKTAANQKLILNSIQADFPVLDMKSY